MTPTLGQMRALTKIAVLCLRILVELAWKIARIDCGEEQEAILLWTDRQWPDDYIFSWEPFSEQDLIQGRNTMMSQLNGRTHDNDHDNN